MPAWSSSVPEREGWEVETAEWAVGVEPTERDQVVEEYLDWMEGGRVERREVARLPP